ncbi:MAG: MarR family transcriptional regulator, partial [Streptomyces sp.]|nr:MarR family transcriptional regulator [Streptomyces sp.]NUS14811.1 MarR family transcriptional regulator [Streptomyces sp.]
MAADLQILGRAVKAAQYRQHRTLDSRLASVGSTLAQWDALRAVARTPGASARELAAATFQTE